MISGSFGTRSCARSAFDCCVVSATYITRSDVKFLNESFCIELKWFSERFLMKKGKKLFCLNIAIRKLVNIMYFFNNYRDLKNQGKACLIYV